MKKGYYLFPTYVKRNESLVFTGVMNKMDMQVKELSKWFDIDFNVIYASSNGTMLKNKVINRLLVCSSLKREYDKIIDEMNNPDFVYIRRVEADHDYIEFLASIREKYPFTKILVEIPTYPYEKDAYRKLKFKIGLLKDRKYRKEYKNYIDRFVTFTNDNMIFGVPTIRTMNGINVESQKLIGEKPETYKATINIIFVGMMQPQHGLERIIKGLEEFNKKRHGYKIKLLLVGHGPEYDSYKLMSSQYGLDKYIKFFGKKTGKELDYIYDCADIAICPLGCYKTLSPETRSSALKTREYLARGLPVVTGCIEDVFEQYNCDYHIDFENNDTILDVEKIVNWYEKLMEKYQSRAEMASEIRNYAYEHVDNASTMKPIIDYINLEER